MIRRKLIAGNWKMNNTNKEALELVASAEGGTGCTGAGISAECI